MCGSTTHWHWMMNIPNLKKSSLETPQIYEDTDSIATFWSKVSAAVGKPSHTMTQTHQPLLESTHPQNKGQSYPKTWTSLQMTPGYQQILPRTISLWTVMRALLGKKYQVSQLVTTESGSWNNMCMRSHKNSKTPGSKAWIKTTMTFLNDYKQLSNWTQLPFYHYSVIQKSRYF